MVEYMKKYLEEYTDEKEYYKEYKDETIIEDILYMLGVALNPEKNSYASGFLLFKRKLREHLGKENEIESQLIENHLERMN